jgi:hypothetical protein
MKTYDDWKLDFIAQDSAKAAMSETELAMHYNDYIKRGGFDENLPSVPPSTPGTDRRGSSTLPEPGRPEESPQPPSFLWSICAPFLFSVGGAVALGLVSFVLGTAWTILTTFTTRFVTQETGLVGGLMLMFGTWVGGGTKWGLFAVMPGALVGLAIGILTAVVEIIRWVKTKRGKALDTDKMGG